MKNKIYSILLILSLFLNISSIVHAENISPTFILTFNEVNFKNQKNDWLTIYYSRKNQEDLNLKGFQFEDDKVFKKIEEDFIIKPGDIITLTFKSDSKDNNNDLQLFTNHKGLTATTEQIILKDPANNIIDAVCWASEKIAKAEYNDQKKLFEKQAWISEDPSTCFSSENIKNNQSILKKDLEQDTNNSEDWITKINNEEEKKSNTDKKEIVKNKNKNTEKKNSTSKKKQSSKTKKNYKNGALSDQIIINEIFPRAKEKDKENEWIELYNKGNQDINLGNWSIDDQEGGSKPYIIPDTIVIKAKDFLLLKAPETKISLGNQKDQVRLFDFNKKLIDIIEYEEAPKNQSYARIKIQNNENETEEKWFFEKEISPANSNPFYIKLEGTIISDPNFENEYFFEIKTENGQTKKIIFSEEIIPGPLAKATFTKETKLKILAAKVKDKEDLKLKQYEAFKPSQATHIDFQGNFILGGAGIIGFILLYLFKKLPWQK